MIVDFEIFMQMILLLKTIFQKQVSYIDKYFDQSYTYDPSKL